MKEAEMKNPFLFQRGISLSLFFFKLIFRCIGSLLLCMEFPQLRRLGANLQAQQMGLSLWTPTTPTLLCSLGSRTCGLQRLWHMGFAATSGIWNLPRLGMGLILPALVDRLLINYQTTRDVQEENFCLLDFKYTQLGKTKIHIILRLICDPSSRS